MTYFVKLNRPSSFSAKKSLDGALFLYILTRFDGVASELLSLHSEILQNVAKYRSLEILFQNSYKVYGLKETLGSKKATDVCLIPYCRYPLTMVFLEIISCCVKRCRNCDSLQVFL